MQESFRQYARSVKCKFCLNYDYLYIFTSYTPFTLSKNYPDHNLDSNLDCDLDCSIQQSALHCCSLFSHCYIAIHLISQLKSFRSGQYFLTQIAI